MFPDQTPHSAKSHLDLDFLSISHGCIYSYFDLFIAQVVLFLGVTRACTRSSISDSYFLNKGDSCISTNSTCTCMYILTTVPIYIAQLIQRLEI